MPERRTYTDDDYDAMAEYSVEAARACSADAPPVTTTDALAARRSEKGRVGMRGWVRTGFMVGGMWTITWVFWLIGEHTPMSFAVALVGVTGMGLTLGCALHATEPHP